MIPQSLFVRTCLLLALATTIWFYSYFPAEYISVNPTVAVTDNTSTETVPSSTSLSPDDFLNKQSSIPSRRYLSSYILLESNNSFIHPEFPCNNSVFLVIVVCSAIPNFQAREAIRKTWGQHTASDVQVYFLLGRTEDGALQATVANESSKYSDIIQEDFLDTYNNLTLKSVMLLKWVNVSCGHAKYVMKTDDDMFVHLPNLRALLESKGHSKLLVGCLIKGAKPVKDRNSKWYVSEEMFLGDQYPPYLSGTGYVFSGETVPDLYKAALEMKFFYLEDIFITGICASKIGLRPVDNIGFRYHKRSNSYCTFQTLITAHRMTAKELYSVWNKLQTMSSTKCEPQRQWFL